MTTLHPLKTTRLIRESYLRYLKTSYPFQESGLREAFWQALDKPDTLLKGPLLEAAPPFESGRSIAQLVAAGILHPNWEHLCSDALPWERTPYLHQEQALSKVVTQQQNLIVATGTGSGKTESFLLPILDHLLREEATGTLGHGVRALLLYPMNALANDQLKRLRRVLADYSAITFGRYTGETEERQDKAEDAFYRQFPDEPTILDNELISRTQMRATPPHLLLTNYAMLEYLLLRPEDCEFFDGPPARHWRFIVLDEAHIYDGASGIEIAMLLRRLKDRVVGSEQGRLRCIATSATLGRGRADFPAAAAFAQALFDEPFRWDDEDESQQNVVEATRVPTAKLGKIRSSGTPALYLALRQALTLLPDEADAPIASWLAPLVEAATPHLPAPLLAEAQQVAEQGHPGAQAVASFLHALLRSDAHLHDLHKLLRDSPHFLDSAAQTLFPDQPEGSEALISLVDLAVRARPDATSLALLPARYHVFARALEGAFACLHDTAHTDKKPHLFLERRETCPDCKAPVVELASCSRCGGTYVLGRLIPLGDDDGSRQYRLQSLPHSLMDGPGQRAYFLLGNQVSPEDEDDAVVAGEQGTDEQADPFVFCVRCGLVTAGTITGCGCGSAHSRPLSRVRLHDHPEPRRCVQCGSRSTRGLVYRFLTGQDAPVSVLATALYQQLPPSEHEQAATLPGAGRKLLIFSDSRQDAAFFAPYLERTYQQLFQRRLILKSLLDTPSGRAGTLRLDDLIPYLRQAAERAGLFHHNRDSHAKRERRVTVWLMQELITWNRRLGLEGLGLLHFRLIRPAGWRAPTFLQAAPWHLTEDESWTLLALLLDTLRQQGVVTFPEPLSPRDEEFAPRNVELFMRGAQSEPYILSWVPTRGSNRRLELLERLLAQRTPSLAPPEQRSQALVTLEEIWKHLTERRGVWRDYLVMTLQRGQGSLYRLSHEFWELLPSQEGQGYRCTRCRTVTNLNLVGLCPTNGCTGTLEPFDPTAPSLVENHYRALYGGMEPIPLSIQEHTAQWSKNDAGQIQEQFVRGELNALSCSTTFELGVDVGELQAVLMRNMPPTTANYVQRAGRAGRRTDSAAFALTYAQRRSHDLTHYNDPSRIVAGRIQPPRLILSNEKIARRHMQAVLLAQFFRQEKERGYTFKSVGAFFEETDGPAQLHAFAASQPPSVLEALRRIVPDSLQGEVGVETWGWLQTEAGDGFLDRLERATEEIETDFTLYREEEAAAAEARHAGRLGAAQQVLRTLRSRSLLGYLASRNLLPKYGFPTDAVELKTNHLPQEEARQIELQRDLRIAIAEYAPGAEVVAAKRVWTGGGLYKPSHKRWQSYDYTICPICSRYERRLVVEGDENPPAALCVCGAKLRQRRDQYGTFVVPEFGFVASDTVRSSDESRPQRLYASRVYFAEYAPPSQAAQDPDFEWVESLSGREGQVAVYYSRFGKLALINAGEQGAKFRLCEWCGYATKGSPAQRGSRGNHKHPRTGKACNGPLVPRALGHEFQTDVTEIRFTGRLAARMGTTLPQWRSLLYALLEGSASGLSIRRDDLDGTLLYRNWGEPPSVMLFDDVPGGAGHVGRIAQELEAVFRAAYQRVATDCCGPETSCYECLRSYRNQPYHDELTRGVVRDFLGAWLDWVPATP